jgi:hypothetical protein
LALPFALLRDELLFFAAMDSPSTRSIAVGCGAAVTIAE